MAKGLSPQVPAPLHVWEEIKVSAGCGPAHRGASRACVLTAHKTVLFVPLYPSFTDEYVEADQGHELLLKNTQGGCLGGSAVERLPSAQGMIPESWDRVPLPAPAWNLLLSLPMSLPLSVCLS